MVPSIEQLTGFSPVRASVDPTSTMRAGVASAAGPSAADQVPPFSPDSPLFWFAALAAVTFGLVGISTSVRVGPLRGSASAGKT